MNRQQAVIIGAGLGGLAAAAALAADGWDVSIYEKNDKIGGKLDTARQDGYTFDLGPSIVTMPEVFREVFRRAGQAMEDYVSMCSIDPHWRTFFPDGTSIDVTADLPDMISEMSKVSERPGSQLSDFLSYSEDMYDLCMKSFYKISYGCRRCDSRCGSPQDGGDEPSPPR